MPKDFPIRNKKIEEQHSSSLASEVTTRLMTDEEWEKYGPKTNKARKPIIHYKRKGEIKSVKKKLDIPTIIELAKKHTLDAEGREAIAKECGLTRVDVTNFVCRSYVKKALVAEGLINNNTEKANTNKAESYSKKQLNVPMEQPEKNESANTVTKGSSMPINPAIELHMNLCADLHETFVAKNTAYGNSFSLTFQEFGIVSALTRLSDKWNRIKSLAKGAKNDVKDESLIDSLMDMSNYCVMTVMELMSNQS